MKKTFHTDNAPKAIDLTVKQLKLMALFLHGINPIYPPTGKLVGGIEAQTEQVMKT